MSTPDKLTKQIIDFVRSIGIPVSLGNIPKDNQFLPGIYIEHGDILIDLAELKYPGDILHEAGHLAVTIPAKRMEMIGALDEAEENHKAAEEMMAIAWSYAAAIHIGIDPHIVFHDAGYKGASNNIVEDFSNGRFFGVSMLQWVGLTYEAKNAKENNTEPFPYMLKWIREKE